METMAAPAHGYDRRGLLAGHAVLGNLEPGDLDQLLGFARIRRIAAGEVIFRKSDAGNSMMSIVAGRVKVGVRGSDGREAVLAILGPGEMLGEMAIFDGHPRSADATALDQGELLVLNRRDVIPFLERHPAIAIRLLGIVCGRLRRASGIIEDRAFLSLSARLAKALLDLGSADGDPPAAGSRLDLNMSQKTFASLLGTSRETLNKLLHDWAEAGMIRTGRGYLIIEQPESLSRMIAEHF
jgi:CRP-like cAMP-binding protein